MAEQRVVALMPDVCPHTHLFVCSRCAPVALANGLPGGAGPNETVTVLRRDVVAVLCDMQEEGLGDEDVLARLREASGFER